MFCFQSTVLDGVKLHNLLKGFDGRIAWHTSSNQSNKALSSEYNFLCVIFILVAYVEATQTAAGVTEFLSLTSH